VRRADGAQRFRLAGTVARLALAAAVLAPASARAEAPDEGRWRELRVHRDDQGLDDEQRAMLERLEAIGYATGSVTAPEDLSGVTRYEPERSQAGLNLYSSGHAPEALLMDMEGRILHRWGHDFHETWPELRIAHDRDEDQYWRRVHLFSNGDLLAIHEGIGVLRLDRDSKLLWASAVRAHHDLHVPDGDEIYVLSRKARVVPFVHEREPVLEDFVSVLDGATGKEKQRVSLLRALERSPWAGLWRESEPRTGDIFHTNSIEVLDGSWEERIAAFRKGNVLVSLREVDALAVLDMEAEAIVWLQRGTFARQHDPTPLPNGHLLLFDNAGLARDRSRVLEIDPRAPESQTVAWEFRDSEEEPLVSPTCGTAARLPNGNTLVTESDGGRALEVTPDGSIVWEYYNPHRAGDEGQYIATIFEMVRLPADFAAAWLPEPPSEPPTRANAPGHREEGG